MFFRKDWCRIKFFNIAFFASVMWFWGLALASLKLEQVLKLDFHFWKYLLYFALLYFIIVLFWYFIKIFINFSYVKADFSHNVKSNFFPGIWKIFIIFSIWFLHINTEISKYFWIIWVVVQFLFAVILFRRWLIDKLDIKTLNPLWFLPIVWNLLAPIAWVPLWFIELSWFFFSIWFIMWLVMFTIIMNRIIFHNPLPAKLLPTLFILIAPPSVWFISYTILNWWNLTDFSRVIYYFSIFLFIILISKINILRKLKFFLSWWAYSFPMAVFTNATFMYYSLVWNKIILYMWLFFYFILILIIFWLLFRTMIWIKRKELCVEEE